MKSMTEYSSELMRERTKFKRQMLKYIYDETEALELFMEGSDYLGMILDRQGIILRVNQNFCNYLGWKEYDMEGKHYTNFMYPDENSNEMFKSGQSIGENKEWEYTNFYRGKDGSKKPVTWAKARIDSNGYRYAKAKPGA